MLIGAVLLAACGGPAKNTVGGGSGSDTTVSNPTPSAGVPCAQEVALVCADGFADGCGGQKTTVHACVAADANAGPPCAQEIALQCPDGQIDACLSTPAAAENHICILKSDAAAAPAATPEAAAAK
ncbi:MAG: hypothetical protein ACKV2T_25290 [Kofleriaceae bacterium]